MAKKCVTNKSGIRCLLEVEEFNHSLWNIRSYTIRNLRDFARYVRVSYISHLWIILNDPL